MSDPSKRDAPRRLPLVGGTPPRAGDASGAVSDPRDLLGRPLRDVRISVTDRCNFRCRYCMPREHFGADYQYADRSEILSFEEIARLGRVFATLGARKFRLTGGEPLLRRELHLLVAMLAEIPGVELALTTNGSRLAEHAEALAKAGLRRVTVSLDSLDDRVFQTMNDTSTRVADVLEGIDAAARAGLGPVKINAVVCRGVNEHGVVDLARHFRGTGHIVRFIEYMDVGTTNAWSPEQVVPGSEIVARISRELPLEPASPNYAGEVASRWCYSDGSGEIGVITSVSRPFCGDCTRLRLSADGRLFTCLFANDGTDVRDAVRGGATQDDLAALVAGTWRARSDRYSELRAGESGRAARPEMPYLGG